MRTTRSSSYNSRVCAIRGRYTRVRRREHTYAVDRLTSWLLCVPGAREEPVQYYNKRDSACYYYYYYYARTS
jgi:hypothetical protein